MAQESRVSEAYRDLDLGSVHNHFRLSDFRTQSHNRCRPKQHKALTCQECRKGPSLALQERAGRALERSNAQGLSTRQSQSRMEERI